MFFPYALTWFGIFTLKFSVDSILKHNKKSHLNLSIEMTSLNFVFIGDESETNRILEYIFHLLKK